MLSKGKGYDSADQKDFDFFTASIRLLHHVFVVDQIIGYIAQQHLASLDLIRFNSILDLPNVPYTRIAFIVLRNHALRSIYFSLGPLFSTMGSTNQ